MKGKLGMCFLSLCLGVLLLACEGADSALDASTARSKGEPEEAAVDSLAIKAKQAILAYPALTDANCEEFLLTWAAEHPEHRFELTTSKGDMLLETFEDVPIHSANFHYKVARKYYAPSEFVRIVPDFVVQGGNSEDTRAQELRWLIGKHTLPAEFHSNRLHFHGALAMGRTYEGNPEKRSASYDFYLVVGRKVTRAELARLEREKGFTYTEAQKARYVREGGTPHLDFEHTVFGQLTDGFDALKALSIEPTDASDWPLRRQEFRLKVQSD
jgi:cyclophilin family peptidyl-prolyl cis-trans isomerase